MTLPTFDSALGKFVIEAPPQRGDRAPSLRR
jgi:hypothetical protein